MAEFSDKSPDELGDEIEAEDPAKIDPAKENDNRATAHLCVLALTLFDKTRPLHDLKKGSRQVMELAAKHHQLPLPKGKKRSIGYVRKELKKALKEEITAGDLEILSAVVAIQRGRLKRKDVDRLDLSPIQQRATLTLAALLRIAAGISDGGKHKTTIQQVNPGTDRVWIVIDGPHAAGDAVVGQHKANLWSKIGYPEVKVLQASEKEGKLLLSPEPTDQIGLESCDPLAEAARKVMRFHFARMLQNEEGTRLGEDIEALHDMRVATRRLRASFDVFVSAFEPGVLRSYLKGLRKTGRALGKVRDIDVFLEKVQHYVDGLAEGQPDSLSPLMAEWQSRRAVARAEMLDYLDSPDFHEFKREFTIFLNTPGAGARQMPSDQPLPFQVCELAPVLIYTRMAAVRAYQSHLEDASLELLHALRIEFKKLRYSVEYFSEVLGETAHDVVDDLKALQDHLGDLNDAHLAVALLKDFIKDWEKRQKEMDKDQRQSLDGVASYQNYRREERQRLFEGFPEAWSHFDRPEFRQNLAEAIATL